MYLSYNDYLLAQGDFSISEEQFTKLEFKARKKVDKVTFSRFKKLEAYPEELTLLMGELIDFYRKDTGEVITSRSSSQGSISQSESYAVNVNTDKAEDLIKLYLADTEVNNVSVLYRG